MHKLICDRQVDEGDKGVVERLEALGGDTITLNMDSGRAYSLKYYERDDVTVFRADYKRGGRLHRQLILIGPDEKVGEMERIIKDDSQQILEAGK